MTDSLYHPSRFCTAPMIDWTDRHCRYFFRLFSKEMQIYTEMVTCGAILHGDTDRFLGYSDEEQPLVLQLGGSNSADLGRCAKIAADRGYSEINLNLGCPSPRVQKGAFGACLMAEKQLVVDCVKAMQDASDVPVSIKCRLGIDNLDSDEFLLDFLSALDDIECHHWVIHARIALLQGLSPKENRTVPPLNYDRVYLAKETFPHARIILNGGLMDVDQSLNDLKNLDGVMLGRAAYQNTQVLLDVDQKVFDKETPIKTPFDIAEEYADYINTLTPREQKVAIRHTLGLFNGLRGAKPWRRYLSEGLSNGEEPLALWDEGLRKIKHLNETTLIESE
ncbi:MAG: tRNA dihydrouridine(20/20a) synthase DusA [Pseudomonadota bacterium]|nr:tRNA dihydrouridine(20/20a) synthase DusA [Pseudomonadota bacterium]